MRPLRPLKRHPANTQRGKSNLLFILIAAVAIGIGFLAQTSKKLPAETPEFSKIILLPTPKALTDAGFRDHNTQAFGLEQFKGKWSILFFGFTNCPDVCPTTMQTLKQVKQKLVDANVWNGFQVVMVSVDPERDSIERLANYVPYFDPEFIGVSGSVENTTEFAKNVGILFFKGKETNGGNYDVDHGASLILVNTEGQYAGVITAPHVESEISSDLIALADFAGIKPSPTATIAETTSTEVASNNATSDQKTSIEITNAWIRPAPPNATSMAAYFDIVNHSQADVVIYKSDSTAFNMSMIHETVIEDGVASMKHLESITIPAGQTVSFAPMGAHVMLMGPKQALPLGESAQIVLSDETGQQYAKTIEVRPQPNN